MPKRLTLEDVEQYLKLNCSDECTLISTEYKNVETKMLFKCKCGNHFLRNFHKLQLGRHNCNNCRYDNVSKIYSLDYEFVKKYVNEKECLLISNSYKNSKTKLKIQCRCGNIFYRTFSKFKKSNICYSCYIKNNSGKNNHNYNGGTSEIIDSLRKSIKPWKKEVLKKFNYKCCITGNKKYFVVHHLYSFSNILKDSLNELNLPLYETIAEYGENFEKLKNKVLEKHTIDNGVVITRYLHDKFHNKHGRGNNNKEQFESFFNVEVNSL